MAKIELIHGDCMDYLPKYKDNEFDLAIVDPPYGIKDWNDRGTNKNRVNKSIEFTASIIGTFFYPPFLLILIQCPYRPNLPLTLG